MVVLPPSASATIIFLPICHSSQYPMRCFDGVLDMFLNASQSGLLLFLCMEQCLGVFEKQVVAAAVRYLVSLSITSGPWKAIYDSLFYETTTRHSGQTTPNEDLGLNVG